MKLEIQIVKDKLENNIIWIENQWIKGFENVLTYNEIWKSCKKLADQVATLKFSFLVQVSLTYLEFRVLWNITFLE